MALSGSTRPGETAQAAICAQVRIQIDQRAVITRTAFRATLSVTNALSTPLEQFRVDLDVRDAQGQPAAALFVGLTKTASMSGFTVAAVDGSGVIPAAVGGQPAVATAEWLILPTDQAAPDSNSRHYTVGGSVSHTEGGVLVTVPLFPAPIDVFPDAKLFLKYYLQSPVYGDSPFTSVIEPPEPFTLGLVIRNDGLGAARNFRITSGQPIITSNDSGLLVNFQMIGAQIGNQPVAPCLTLNFGDIAPNSTTIGRWLLTSSLQGFFTDYAVTFEHVNPVGGGAVLSQDVSLIGGVDIFETHHVVRLTGLGQDDKPDFLVRRDPIGQPGTAGGCTGQLFDPMPDEIHVSDGTSILPILPLTQPVFDGPPTTADVIVNMTVDVPQPGWGLIRGVDPGQGAFGLASVRRMSAGGGRVSLAVGGPGDIGNAWTTHRWVPIDCTTPYQLHQIWVLDQFASPGQYVYELTYLPDPQVSLFQLNTLSVGAQQKSNISDVRVRFTTNTNIPTLIANGTIGGAVLLQRRLPGGLFEPIGLSPSRFTYDRLNRSLLVDLTEDSVGSGLLSMLNTDGNYELQLNTTLITSASGSQPLDDTDGVVDGFMRFGDDQADSFFVWRGDVDGSRTVDLVDLNRMLAAFPSSPTTMNWDPDCDLNANGAVGMRDIWRLRRNWMHTLAFQ